MISPDLVLVIALAVFFLLMVLEAPVSMALAAAGAVGVVAVRGFDVVTAVFANVPFTATSSYSLSIIPMYILLGMFALNGYLAKRVYSLASRILGWLPGGLGVATVGACAGFAAVSGSSVATAATIGRVSIGEMRRFGYSPAFAGSIVAMAGTLGILIPPSVILVVYGVATEQSISTLILAAIVPGILSAVAFMVYISLRVARDIRAGRMVGPSDLATELEKVTGEKRAVIVNSDASPSSRNADAASSPNATGTTAVPVLSSQKETWPSLIRAGLWITVIFVVILVGTFSGQFTVIESAGVGAFVALFALIFETGREGWRPFGVRLRNSLYESATTTSATFMILVGASIFAYFLVLIRVPIRFADWVTSLDVPPLVIVILCLLALVPLGMFLDSLSITVIVAPILAPVVAAIGFDGIVFGILFVILIEIGLVTPPVGMNVYVVGAVSKVPVASILRGVLPFLGVQVIVIAILIAFPGITLWLPGLVN